MKLKNVIIAGMLIYMALIVACIAWTVRQNEIRAAAKAAAIEQHRQTAYMQTE